MGAAQDRCGLETAQDWCGLLKDRAHQRGGDVDGNIDELIERLFHWCGLLKDRAHQRDGDVDGNIEELIERLFHVQDLNGDGLLDESELVQLNTKLAILHYGKEIDKAQVKSKYQDIFRNDLDPEGSPVALDTFRRHTLKVLRAQDRDKLAQSFILEQWIAEAESARRSFSIPSWHSISDVPFLLQRSCNDARSTDAEDAVTLATPGEQAKSLAEAAARLCCCWLAHTADTEAEVAFGEEAPCECEEATEESPALPQGAVVPRAPPPSEAATSGHSAASGVPTVKCTVVPHGAANTPRAPGERSPRSPKGGA